MPSSYHHPNILSLVLRRPTELHLIDLRKLRLLPVLSSKNTCTLNLLKSAFWYRGFKSFHAFVLALSAILLALSYLSYANIFIAFIIKMVVLTIIADSNHRSLEKYQHISLMSCLPSNSWFSLKRTEEISVFDSQGNATVKITPKVNYLLKRLGQALQDTLKSERVKVEMNTLKGTLEIHNPQNKDILLDNDLTDLGIKWPLQTINLVKRFVIHQLLCRLDLFDKNENVFNGEP